MVFIKLTAQEKHTWKYSKYDIQAHGLAEAETEKTPETAHWSNTLAAMAMNFKEILSLSEFPLSFKLSHHLANSIFQILYTIFRTEL